MPECPHCREYYFGNPESCPNCKYHFKLKKIITEADIQRQRDDERKKREAIIAKNEETKRQESIQKEKIAIEKSQNILKNAHYEYKTEYLYDSWKGGLEKGILDQTLSSYAENGWRLHSIITNEMGKNASSVSVGGTSFGTNSTMDVTILIFERCIKPAEF